MRIKYSHRNVFIVLLAICSSCVPLQHQISDTGDSEIDEFIGPLVIDKEQFNQVASRWVHDRLKIDDNLLPHNDNVTYEGTLEGKLVYINNCKCFEDPKIIQDKLVITHSYGGGESNRESTKLLWNGEYYQNSKGEYIVDVILHSDKIDIRRAHIQEKKIHDVAGLQHDAARFIWINLLGYNRLIHYDY